MKDSDASRRLRVQLHIVIKQRHSWYAEQVEIIT